MGVMLENVSAPTQSNYELKCTVQDDSNNSVSVHAIANCCKFQGFDLNCHKNASNDPTPVPMIGLPDVYTSNCGSESLLTNCKPFNGLDIADGVGTLGALSTYEKMNVEDFLDGSPVPVSIDRHGTKCSTITETDASAHVQNDAACCDVSNGGAELMCKDVVVINRDDNTNIATVDCPFGYFLTDCTGMTLEQSSAPPVIKYATYPLTLITYKYNMPIINKYYICIQCDVYQQCHRQ